MRYLKMNYTIERVWDLLSQYGIATSKELQLVTTINGYNIDTLEDVLYARTGLRSIEQLLNEIEEDYRYE